MATTTFTNATDYGPDDSINSVVNINGITAGNVTNVRFEIDWNPNGADPFCGGDASSSSCTVTDPDGSVVNMFSSYTKSGANARTDTHDITSGFASTFNGNYTFALEDEDAMGCNTVTETRIIVTYTEVAANNPSVSSLGVEVVSQGSGPLNNPSISSLGVEVVSQGSGPANNPSISSLGVEVVSQGSGPSNNPSATALGVEVIGVVTVASSNNVRFGSTTITKAYLGSQQLSKIRLGEQVIEL
tara:strand:+ start:636 stop:1367 length:732 start_codon:yes stop_codon:yes gene_type:complete